jgi:hypothetical protein
MCSALASSAVAAASLAVDDPPVKRTKHAGDDSSAQCFRLELRLFHRRTYGKRKKKKKKKKKITYSRFAPLFLRNPRSDLNALHCKHLLCGASFARPPHPNASHAPARTSPRIVRFFAFAALFALPIVDVF